MLVTFDKQDTDLFLIASIIIQKTDNTKDFSNTIIGLFLTN